MALLLALSAGLLGLLSLAGAATRFPTAIGFSLPRSTLQAHRVADWINARTGSGDLVLAMPQIAPLLDARSAELLEAVARDGQGTAFYPAGIDPTRFAYDPRLDAARFVVIDDFTRSWIKVYPRERALVARAYRSWRVVYRRGEYMVLAPPGHDRAGSTRRSCMQHTISPIVWQYGLQLCLSQPLLADRVGRRVPGGERDSAWSCLDPSKLEMRSPC